MQALHPLPQCFFLCARNLCQARRWLFSPHPPRHDCVKIGSRYSEQSSEVPLCCKSCRHDCRAHWKQSGKLYNGLFLQNSLVLSLQQLESSSKYTTIPTRGRKIPDNSLRVVVCVSRTSTVPLIHCAVLGSSPVCKGEGNRRPLLLSSFGPKWNWCLNHFGWNLLSTLKKSIISVHKSF